MHKRKAEAISEENINRYPQNKKHKPNSNANSKQKSVSRASFVASLVGYDSKAKPTFLVGSKKVSLDFIKADKPQLNPAPQAKYIDINPALVVANKNNQKNVTNKRANQPRDVTVNAIKKHLQIRGTVQTAGTIQKLRKSLCEWDQTQGQPQNRQQDDIISSPMLPPAPKQPKKPVVKRTEAFIYDSTPKPQQNVVHNNNESFVRQKNDESFGYEAFDGKENEKENESSQSFEDFSSPFIYNSSAPSTDTEIFAVSTNQSANDSLNSSSDDIDSSPFALTMSFNQTQSQMTQQSKMNGKLKNSYDSLNSTPFVYNPTRATPAMTPANITPKKFGSKGSRISQLMDSQQLSMSSPFIYVETQDEKQLNNSSLKHSNDEVTNTFEEVTTQTESSENCSGNLNSSPFIYLTTPSTNVNQKQRSPRKVNGASKNNDNSAKNENSEPQKSKFSSQHSLSDLEFCCSPDLFATQHKY
jgi:hypothetical protein